jgi:hypothetical protein
MQLDRDGILQVSATDVTTSAEASTTIVHTHRVEPGAADQAVKTLVIG